MALVCNSKHQHTNQTMKKLNILTLLDLCPGRATLCGTKMAARKGNCDCECKYAKCITDISRGVWAVGARRDVLYALRIVDLS